MSDKIMAKKTVTILNPKATDMLLVGARAVVEKAVEKELRKYKGKRPFGKITSINRRSQPNPFSIGTSDTWNHLLNTWKKNSVFGPIVKVFRKLLSAHRADQRRGHYVTFGFSWFVEDLLHAPAPFPDPDCDVSLLPFFVWWSVRGGRLIVKIDQMRKGDLVVKLPFPSSVIAGGALTPIFKTAATLAKIPSTLDAAVAKAKKNIGGGAHVKLIDLRIQGRSPKFVADFEWGP